MEESEVASANTQEEATSEQTVATVEAVISLLLNEGVVAYQLGLARAVGAHSPALLLSQFWYWTERLPSSRDGWFYISQEEIYEQTIMTRREQETARRKLREAGFLLEKKQGLPAKLWYKVDRSAVVKFLIEHANKDGVKRQPRKAKTDKQGSPETPANDGANEQSGSAQTDTHAGANPTGSDGANRHAITETSAETSADTSSYISSDGTLNVGEKNINITTGASEDTNHRDTDASTFEAVEAVVQRFDDAKSRQRFKQLRLLCRDNNRLGLWQEALRSTERRMKHVEMASPGGYFCTVIVRLLEDEGINIPAGTKQQRAEVSDLIGASLAAVAGENYAATS